MPNNKSSKKPNLKVVKESSTGRNTKLQDTRTGKVMTPTQVKAAINRGEYPGYHSRTVNKKTVIASNPDGTKRNNLD